jgi:ribosome recycling factor
LMCKTNLRLWYESQSVENRKEVAKDAKKTMENFKLVAEQCFQELVMLTLSDI